MDRPDLGDKSETLATVWIFLGTAGVVQMPTLSHDDFILGPPFSRQRSRRRLQRPPASCAMRLLQQLELLSGQISQQVDMARIATSVARTIMNH